MTKQKKPLEDTIMILRVSSKKAISIENVNLPEGMTLFDVLVQVRESVGAYLNKKALDVLKNK